MANPIFNALNARQQPNIMQNFQSFMQQMRGKDPNAIISQMVSSGRVSQAQLDQVQRQAQQMQGMFNGMKSMFGF